MSDYVVHAGAIVQCQHGGQATPLAVNPRVKVSNQAIVTLNSPYTIALCSLASSGSTFCASAQWIKAAARIKAGGVPVVLKNSQATCVNTGMDLKVMTTQMRVKGT